MAFAVPIMMAAGAIVQGAQQKNAADYNAAVMEQEKKTALAQGYEAEAQQRRAGTAAIGREVAAAGQSGGGYGGSVGRVVKQSAVNTELDALNIRYKAAMQAWGYGEQASNLEMQGRQAQTNSFIKAGSALLSGYANYGTNLG